MIYFFAGIIEFSSFGMIGSPTGSPLLFNS
jgi:hypothetical protein